jgi:catechol 2,3-dioxygenase-like lactoylglutathione lyase family enzyme
MAVPEVLLSGHHEEIARWRRRQSVQRTATRRPDMLREAKLTPEEERLAAGAQTGSAATAHLFRVSMPVSDMARGVTFYRAILEMEGELVAPNRHYFRCGGTILAVVDPAGHEQVEFRPNIEHVYFAVPDLTAAFERARSAECSWLEDRIRRREWGERSFYARDPFGNPICFVDERTVFVGKPA